jgi:hypothetical protein
MSSDTIEFRILVHANADIGDSQARLIAAVNDQPGLTVDKVERLKPFGMTGAEIAISFVVSVASSALVHVARDRIDDAAKRVSEDIKRPLRIVFKRKEVEKTEFPDNVPNGPEMKPGE